MADARETPASMTTPEATERGDAPGRPAGSRELPGAGERAPQQLDAGSVSIIGILLVSAFVVILNETAMNVALARIMDDLLITESLAQWLTTAFMLTMAVVIPTTGWLMQRLTTRSVFILAMSLFSAGTLIAAVAPVFEVLIVGRVVQAGGTAIMMPLLMTTIMALVPPTSRGKVMGNVSIVMAVAPAIGPSVSGVILSVADWRFIFVAVLPIALAALVIGALKLRNVGEHRETRLDALSVVLSAFGFGGVVYGLSQLGSPDTAGASLGIALGVGVLGLALFVRRQLRLQRTDDALLDLRTFRSTSFSIATVIMSIAMMALFGIIIILPLLMQNAYAMDPLAVGLSLLPGGLIMGLLGPPVGALYDRFGPRVLVVPGAIVVLGAFAILASISIATPWWMLMVAHIVLSIGLAFLFTPLFTVALGSLTPKLYSHGSAIIGTVQQLAGAAGTALFVAIMVIFAGGSGADVTPAQSIDGARAAFIAAGLLWIIALVASCFTRRPADESVGEVQDARAAHA